MNQEYINELKEVSQRMNALAERISLDNRKVYVVKEEYKSGCHSLMQVDGRLFHIGRTPLAGHTHLMLLVSETRMDGSVDFWFAHNPEDLKAGRELAMRSCLFDDLLKYYEPEEKTAHPSAWLRLKPEWSAGEYSIKTDRHGFFYTNNSRHRIIKITEQNGDSIGFCVLGKTLKNRWIKTCLRNDIMKYYDVVDTDAALEELICENNELRQSNKDKGDALDAIRLNLASVRE